MLSLTLPLRQSTELVLGSEQRSVILVSFSTRRMGHRGVFMTAHLARATFLHMIPMIFTCTYVGMVMRTLSSMFLLSHFHGVIIEGAFIAH